MRPIVLARISRGKIFRVHEIPRVAARARQVPRDKGAFRAPRCRCSLCTARSSQSHPPRVGINTRRAEVVTRRVRRDNSDSPNAGGNPAFRAFPLTSVKSAFHQQRRWAAPNKEIRACEGYARERGERSPKRQGGQGMLRGESRRTEREKKRGGSKGLTDNGSCCGFVACRAHLLRIIIAR